MENELTTALAGVREAFARYPRRAATRDRLLRAWERDYDSPWADDLARAYDLLRY
ncbi:hypothetical protein [Micromonospora sp. NPDC005205]|uniref:hypothetical protein n=1 Tax=Micromonospora sp. NPDC005205 TaxID=3156714 RepID=UPI0033B889DC